MKYPIAVYGFSYLLINDYKGGRMEIIMSLITEQIDSIIDKRKSKIKQIDEAISRLEEDINYISNFKKIQNELLSDDEKSKYLFFTQELADKITNVSLDKYYILSQEYMKELKKLKSRFSRDELHISIVGRMRQGKSALIQTITGLNEKVIPSSGGTACTGARSLITNENINKVEADISFYSEREMVNKINSYLENISHNKNYFINYFSEVSSIPISELKELPNLYANESNYIQKLETYKEHVNDIAKNLGKGNIRVDESEIEKYVAQYKHDNINEKYYNFLCVKAADIHCHFPYENVGKIKLLDTIGLEDTMLGVEEDMLKTVENDSDAIIYLRKPDGSGDDVTSQDMRFISKISEAVSAEYSKEMLFWIINKNDNGSNSDLCQAFYDKIKLDDVKASDKIIVNCRDKYEVESKLLEPILTKMKDRIQYVDKIIINRTNSLGEEVFNEHSKIADEINNAFVGSANEDIKRKMESKCKEAYDAKLLHNIRELCYFKYANQKNENCKMLSDAIDEILNNIYTFIPAEEDIIKYICNGSKDQHATLKHCNDIARINIIDKFNELDIVLDDVIKTMKREVVEIMANKALLSKITSYSNNIEPDEWIKRFISDITFEGDKYPQIEKALNDFVNFKCSVQGFLIYEVRDKLYSIDQQLQDQPDAIESKVPHYGDIADEIREILKNHLYWISKEIKKSVANLSVIPNRAMFAAIYDLFDRLTFGDKGLISNIPVTDEWRHLYEDNISKIWSEEFYNYISNQKIAREWAYISESISKMNEIDIFKIEI